MTEKTCIICHSLDVVSESADQRLVRVTCENCGPYRIARSCIELLYERDTVGENIAKYQPSDKKRRIISGHLRYTDNVLIDEFSLPDLMALKPPTITEKADRLIAMILRQSDSFGSEVDISDQSILAALVLTSDETFHLARQLAERGIIERGKSTDPTFSLTFDGWIAAEELSQSQESIHVFIAMSFAADFRELAEKPIREAILSSGMQPLTVDQEEHVGKIDDKIIVDINRSRAIVADFTEHKTGVYFEAGYAMGRGLPVIWTCRDTDLNELHFDIRQYNCIVWATSEDLQSKLTARLKSLFDS